MMPNRAGLNKTTIGGWICFDSHHNFLPGFNTSKPIREQTLIMREKIKLSVEGITGLNTALYGIFDKKVAWYVFKRDKHLLIIYCVYIQD